MKKIITTLSVMLLIASSVGAVERSTRGYAPELLNREGDVDTPVSIKIINPEDASEIDRAEGDIVGYLDDEVCGARGLDETCAVIHDPYGCHRVRDVSTRVRNKGIGDVRNSKIRNVGDRYFRVLRVYHESDCPKLKK